MIDWSLRHCSRNGHITFRPDEPDLASRLRATTPLGEAWRCLRCGDFVLGDPHGGGPADEAPVVRRGRAIRDLLIIRLLAVERLLRAVGLLLAALLVWRVRANQERFGMWVEREIPLLTPLTEQLGWNVDGSWLARTLREVSTVNPTFLTLIAAGLVVYAATQFVEAYGLWHERRWGEYLAAVVTSCFVPVELYELVSHPTALKGVLLLVNVVAVAWLVRSKRLFGVRGGHAAFEAEHASESLLTVSAAAAE